MDETKVNELGSRVVAAIETIAAVVESLTAKVDEARAGIGEVKAAVSALKAELQGPEAPDAELTERDLERLEGVHPDLVQLVRCAAVAPPIPFMVLEGVRSTAQQAENVAKQVSWTMNSRHLTGHAVDLVPLVEGEPSWVWDYYYPLATHIKAMAEALTVAVDWGGDWQKTPDGPHWELNWDAYPLEGEALPLEEDAIIAV